MAAEYQKPLPAPDEDTRAFWDACRAHELRAQRCAACGAFRWPPQGICPHCYSWEFAWTPLEPTGTIDSYVVVHHDTGAFAVDIPYVVVNVTIDGTNGHVRLMSNLVGPAWEDVRVGMRVRAFFDDLSPAITLPKFRPL